MSNHDHEGSRPSKGDAALQRAWRNASDEQPPAHLDAAIVAAARKAVPNRGEQPHAATVRVQPRSWLLQWQPLAAAATVAGLAFVLVQMLPREHDLAPSMQHKQSAPVAAAAPPERVFVPDAASMQGAVPAPPIAPASPAAIAEATANETAATADTAVATGETSADRRQAIESEMAGRTASAAAATPSAREQGLGKAEALDAVAWAAKIAALHQSGDITGAADALRAFRAADPDADTYLPDALREWARMVD